MLILAQQISVFSLIVIIIVAWFAIMVVLAYLLPPQLPPIDGNSVDDLKDDANYSEKLGNRRISPKAQENEDKTKESKAH